MTNMQISHCERRKFKGGTGIPAMIGKKLYCVGRSNNGQTGVPSMPRSKGGNSGKMANITYERGQTKDFQTQLIPGQFKVVMPRGRVRYVEPA